MSRSARGTPKQTVLACSLALAACAGTRPHEMSAEGHRTAAGKDMQAAEEHENPEELTKGCQDEIAFVGECTKTASQHQVEAAHHRDLAEQHLAAEATLRKAEEEACHGIPEAPNYSVLGDPANLSSVTVEEPGEQVVVEIRLARDTSMDDDELRQVVACHRARAAVAGPKRAGVELDPIGTHGVHVAVTTEGPRTVLRLTASSRAAARNLAERGSTVAGQVGTKDRPSD